MQFMERVKVNAAFTGDALLKMSSFMNMRKCECACVEQRS